MTRSFDVYNTSSLPYKEWDGNLKREKLVEAPLYEVVLTLDLEG